MNERIQQLAIDCAGQTEWDFPKPPASFTFNREELAKFAELIVAECLGIVDDAERGGSNEIWDNAVKFIRRDLQEHFGVEQ